VLANAENLGFATACNQGMAAATGELLLLLNSDTYVEDDVIGRATRHLLERFPDGRRQHTANRRSGIRRSLAERLWLYRLLPRERRGAWLLGGYWEEDRDIEVDWLAGAFLLLRRDLFTRSGGFDPRFFMYGEDSEWCARLRRTGDRILYAPRTGVVYHHGAASSHLVWTEDERVERCHRGGLECYAALYGRRRAFLFRLAELLGTAVRAAVYGLAAKLRPGPYLLGQAAHYGRLARFYRSAGR
jgi:GT2 family glycosyltransferase